MSKLCIDLPPIAPDYSGAASALFDLGGIAMPFKVYIVLNIHIMMKMIEMLILLITR